MFGLVLPILFPIALFTFFNMYVMERILVAYYYIQPPMYGDELDNLTLKYMKLAPLFIVFFGYWFLGQP